MPPRRARRGPPIVPSDHMSVGGNHRQYQESSGMIATIREAKNGVLTWRKAHLMLLIITLVCRLPDFRAKRRILAHVPSAERPTATMLIVHTSLTLKIIIPPTHHEQPDAETSRFCQKRGSTLRRNQKKRMKTTSRATRRLYRRVVAASHPPEEVCITATNTHDLKRTKAPGEKTARK